MQPILSISMPPWLYAKTKPILGLTGLVVYRSSAVRDTDPCYQPVQQALDSDYHKTIATTVIDDARMMFGEAELATYLIGSMVGDFLVDALDELRGLADDLVAMVDGSVSAAVGV